jgi:hypothetical protein
MLADHLNSVIMHLPRIRTVLVQQSAIGVPVSPPMSTLSERGKGRADTP